MGGGTVGLKEAGERDVIWRWDNRTGREWGFDVEKEEEKKIEVSIVV